MCHKPVTDNSFSIVLAGEGLMGFVFCYLGGLRVDLGSSAVCVDITQWSHVARLLFFPVSVCKISSEREKMWSIQGCEVISFLPYHVTYRSVYLGL